METYSGCVSFRLKSLRLKSRRLKNLGASKLIVNCFRLLQMETSPGCIALQTEKLSTEKLQIEKSLGQYFDCKLL